MHERLISWYSNYLQHWVSMASFWGVDVHCRVKLGTPQGGVLSPIMWNLAFDRLLELYDESMVKVCRYADAAALIISGETPTF